MGYHFIADHQRLFRVTTMCRVLSVSRSGFYAWRVRAPSARCEANKKLLAHIRHIYSSGPNSTKKPSSPRSNREPTGAWMNRRMVGS